MDPRELLSPQIEFEEDSDPLLNTVAEFEETARYLDLEPWLINRLRHPEREVTVTLPLTRDNGEEFAATGLRVQHRPNAGPTIGPVCMSPDSSLHRLRAVAMALTWQMALLELPFGGAAGAIVCDPEQHSERELRALTRAYAHALRHTLGAGADVLSPGHGCNEQTMAWMISGLGVEASLAARPEPRQLASVVGKPEVLWGIANAYAATAQGICSVLRCLLHPLKGRRVSLQGFDDMGRRLAHLLHGEDMKVTAVADLSGGLFAFRGLNIPALTKHVDHNRVLYGYPQAEAIRNADVLEAECDVLVLAAAPSQVTLVNVDRIRAPLVVVASAGAVTPTAEEALTRRGVIIVPDLIATAGAAIAAASEWKQNMEFPSSFADVAAEVEQRVRHVYEHVNGEAQRDRLTLRQAAVRIAVRRVSEQMRLTARG